MKYITLFLVLILCKVGKRGKGKENCKLFYEFLMFNAFVIKPNSNTATLPRLPALPHSPLLEWVWHNISTKLIITLESAKPFRGSFSYFKGKILIIYEKEVEIID